MPEMIEHDDIAIIGMACRFPGDASSSPRFFDMLCQGRTAWSEIPADRFNKEAYYHPSYDRQGTIVARGGYFLKDDISKWDAPFCSYFGLVL
jgi:acyl transferase domain-containing protein